jgi:hypothetical protein
MLPCSLLFPLPKLRPRTAGARHAPMALALLTFALGNVTPLNPTNWHAQLAGRTWVVMFGVTGCKHCEQMKPMWEEMSKQLADDDGMDVHVGRVNSTSHNGLTKTMRVTDEPALEPKLYRPDHRHAHTTKAPSPGRPGG